MDNLSINAVEDVVATGCYPRDAESVLLVELDGLGVEVASNKHRVAEICRQNGARNITTANDAENPL
ncbi:FAD-linked oxidase C-terminal domain-containing protein [Microcystis aeruginosa]|uniref:FAD-linked oxidase C-terminal domain-containing protein n=1 Tax=Microcystis aeruginosa TaxID=1126 RepID=UPI00202A2075|nr:FAD-linked oxidase C-terminal domain-containing protein [Microcystis aeruginosa]